MAKEQVENGNGKSAIASKTIITNAGILAVVQILQAFGMNISPEISAGLISLIPLANIVLRLVTNSSISSE